MNKKTIFILVLIFVIAAVIIGWLVLLPYLKCGSGGSYVYDADFGGGFCSYNFIAEDKQCQSCDIFCESLHKKRISFAGAPTSFGKFCVCNCQ